MDNESYVASLGVGVEVQQVLLQAMEKYGDNHWWEPGVDPSVLAYYQFHEAGLFVSDFTIFSKAMSELLGRSVMTHEFLRPDQLSQEVQQAWAAKGGVS